MKQQKLIGTKRQLGTMLNLSERRITDLVTAKVIPARGPAGFDLTASVCGYVAFLKSEPSNLKSERLRFAKVKAHILELQLQERTGKLVLRDAVEKATFVCVRRARDQFINLPSRVSGICAAEQSQDVIFRLLTEEIHAILVELSTP